MYVLFGDQSFLKLILCVVIASYAHIIEWIESIALAVKFVIM